MEQKRQYMILQQNDVKKFTSHDTVTPTLTFKCLLSPERYQALVELDFDFSMNDFDIAATSKTETTSSQIVPLPWQDLVGYQFDSEKMLDLLEIHKTETGDCNVPLDKNLMTKCILTKEDDGNNDDRDTVLLYLFQQRLRWENRHQSIRSKVPQVNWILESEDLDVEDILNRMGFSWYDYFGLVINASSIQII
jgi:hypothetical protein